MDLSSLQLVLFFTRGVSLKTWRDGGMLDRELALYRRLMPRLKSVTLVTYGDERDLNIAASLEGFRVVCNHQKLPESDYIKRLIAAPPIDAGFPAVFKSNQVWGADVPLQAARTAGARVVSRCGYLLSDFMERQHGFDSVEAAQARGLEEQIFRLADAAVVTTPAMASVLEEHYEIDDPVVIPNYVITEEFKPDPSVDVDPRQACFIGRLNEQKNPFELLNAFENSPYHLLMVGSGSLKVRLRREIKKRGLPVKLAGNLPHLELPRVLNQSAVFVLPSLYEGHPKTLLEAMSCGRPIVATNVPGIAREVRHNETALVCEPNGASIREAVEALFADPQNAARLGANARAFIMENYALTVVAEREAALYGALMAGRVPTGGRFSA